MDKLVSVTPLKRKLSPDFTKSPMSGGGSAPSLTSPMSVTFVHSSPVVAPPEPPRWPLTLNSPSAKCPYQPMIEEVASQAEPPSPVVPGAFPSEPTLTPIATHSSERQGSMFRAFSRYWPSFTPVTSLFSFPSQKNNEKTKVPIIHAVPVSGGDTSRKKILLDAGLGKTHQRIASQPSAPHKQQKRNKTSPKKASLHNPDVTPGTKDTPNGSQANKCPAPSLGQAPTNATASTDTTPEKAAPGPKAHPYWAPLLMDVPKSIKTATHKVMGRFHVLGQWPFNGERTIRRPGTMNAKIAKPGHNRYTNDVPRKQSKAARDHARRHRVIHAMSEGGQSYTHSEELDSFIKKYIADAQEQVDFLNEYGLPGYMYMPPVENKEISTAVDKLRTTSDDAVYICKPPVDFSSNDAVLPTTHFQHAPDTYGKPSRPILRDISKAVVQSTSTHGDEEASDDGLLFPAVQLGKDKSHNPQEEGGHGYENSEGTPKPRVKFGDEAHIKHSHLEEGISRILMDSSLEDVGIETPMHRPGAETRPDKDVTAPVSKTRNLGSHKRTDGRVPTHVFLDEALAEEVATPPTNKASPIENLLGFQSETDEVLLAWMKSAVTGKEEDDPISQELKGLSLDDALQFEPSEGFKNLLKEQARLRKEKQDADLQREREAQRAKGAQAAKDKDVVPEAIVGEAKALTHSPVSGRKTERRRLIAPLSEKWAQELEAAAKQTEYGKIAKEIVPNKLNTHDFGTLLSADFGGSKSSWLNDNIINEYIKVLVEEEKAKVGWVKKDGDAPPVHAFGSQWWVTAQGGMNKVARWSRRVNLDGRKLLNANLVLFPVCSGAHWTLIAIRPRARTIQYLDSLSRNARGSEPKVETAKAWLKMELGAGYVEEEWRVETGGSCQQLNGSDCGVFTCMNALALIRGQEPKGSIEADNGMLEARRQIAATLLSGASNGIIEE